MIRETEELARSETPLRTAEHGADGVHEAANGAPAEMPAHRRHRRRWFIAAGVVAVLVVGTVWGVPWVRTYLSTVSTDDAYVAGYVSTVAARVASNVEAVYVEDARTVRKGDLLVKLDPEPFRLQVERDRAALEVARAQLAQARSDTRALEAKARAARFAMLNAQDQTRFDIENLKSNIALLRQRQATYDLARREYERAIAAFERQAGTREQVDQRLADVNVSRRAVDEARANVNRTRANLGLGANDANPESVPANIEDVIPTVQAAAADVIQAAAQLGVPFTAGEMTPSAIIRRVRELGDKPEEFEKSLNDIVEKAPATVLARAKVQQAEAALRQAELDLGYCEIRAPITGVVSRRSVNPGNYVQVGRPLMAVRSLDDIWIDANFKETELGKIRIGRPVSIYVDAYPRHTFRGRVSGFAPATGAAMSLLPPENATGNFVKIVQRLPVRIDLVEKNPEDTPLFVGLSVVPYVHINERPTGPGAGRKLGPALPTTTRTVPESTSAGPSSGPGRR